MGFFVKFFLTKDNLSVIIEKGGIMTFLWAVYIMCLGVLAGIGLKIYLSGEGDSKLIGGFFMFISLIPILNTYLLIVTLRNLLEE